MNKRKARLRRARRTRERIKKSNKPWLTIYRTPRHMRAQILQLTRDEHLTPSITVLAAASTLEKDIREKIKGKNKVEAAKCVGKVIAERALAKKIKKLVFDRAGFKYHGRVKALADAAREGGVEF